MVTQLCIPSNVCVWSVDGHCKHTKVAFHLHAHLPQLFCHKNHVWCSPDTILALASIDYLTCLHSTKVWTNLPVGTRVYKMPGVQHVLSIVDTHQVRVFLYVITLPLQLWPCVQCWACFVLHNWCIFNNQAQQSELRPWAWFMLIESLIQVYQGRKVLHTLCNFRWGAGTHWPSACCRTCTLRHFLHSNFHLHI